MKNKEVVYEVKFTKQQLVNSDTFRDVSDVLVAVLDNDKKYTIEEAKKEIKVFYESEVK